MSRTLLIVLGILLVCISLNYELSVKPEFDIIQTSLSDFKPSMLTEKTPIILQDRVVDVEDLVCKLFRYHYLWRTVREKHNAFKVPCNIARFAVIQSRASDSTITLRNPLFENIARIQLHTDQVLIIPRKWEYTVEKGNVKEVLLRDIISCLFG